MLEEPPHALEEIEQRNDIFIIFLPASMQGRACIKDSLCTKNGECNHLRQTIK